MGASMKKIYLPPPSGYRDHNAIWLLQKGLYGLKQPGRISHERLKADVEELGFSNAPGAILSPALEPGGATTGQSALSG